LLLANQYALDEHKAIVLSSNRLVISLKTEVVKACVLETLDKIFYIVVIIKIASCCSLGFLLEDK
jgi:hypothetical protein